MISPEARGDLPSFSAVINSLGACGDLPRSAWITSLGARGSPCGSPPLERVDHLPGARGWSPLERVDHLPSSAWMASLGASERVDVPWVTLMGSPSITARLPGVVAQRVHAAACTCITDEHKARGRQRAGATQRGATTSVCASLCQSFVAEVSRGGVLKTQTIFGPQLFKAVNKVFKSTSWFPWYKSFSLTCKAQRKFHPSIPNFYLKRHLGYLQLPKNVAECAEGVVRDRPVHRWARGARARRPCAASTTPSASSTPAEGLRGARLPALQHPACPLDACARRNRQVRTSTRTLRAGTREVAQRAQRHVRVLRSGRR